jgi:hypothetical protein
MAKASSEWKVLPHGPIERLADNLWWVRGSLPKMSLKRVMTIARLADGRLVIHNAIALEELAMQQIERWGTPAFLVVPSGIHRLDAPAYKRRYPRLRVLAPKGARTKVAQVVPVDGTYEDFPDDPNVRFETLHGMNDLEGARPPSSCELARGFGHETHRLPLLLCENRGDRGRGEMSRDRLTVARALLYQR